MTHLSDRLISASVRHPRVVIACAALAAAAGAFQLARMPVDAIPDLSDPQIVVFADWPGHSPLEIEEQLTRAVAARLGGVERVKTVRTSSESGFCMISVLLDEGADPAPVRARVAERLSALTGLPDGVVPRLAPDATALGQILWYTLEDPGRDPAELRSIHDSLVRPQLASVGGVAEVAPVGGYVREFQVHVDPERLRLLDVSLGQVAAALASSGAAGGSSISHGERDYVVRGTTWAASVEEIESTVVDARAKAPVLLGQVARVRMGPAPRRAFLEKDGAEAVGGVVVVQRGQDPLAVGEAVKRRIAALGPGLPHGVRIVPFYDRGRLVHSAIGTLQRTLLEEICACALMVVLLLGHLRSSLVVIAAALTAVLLAFLAMGAAGIPANLMSLAGIAIAVGVLTDSAVVMTENAHARLQRHPAASAAERRVIALDACLAVGRPLLFSVFVALLSFLPVLALTGLEGRMFRPLALTKTFALAGVALLSVTLVPALIPLLVRGRLRAERESRLVRAAAEVYRPALEFLFERPWWIACSFALLAGAGLHLYPRLGSEFSPPLDEGTIVDMPVSAPGVSLAEAERDVLRRDALIRTLPEVQIVVGKAGRAETATDPAPLEMIETTIALRERGDWPARRLPAETFAVAARAALGDGADPARPQAVAESAERRFDAAVRAALARDAAADVEAIADVALAQAVDAAAADRGVAPRPGWAVRRPALSRKSTADLLRELDGMLQMPGWTNVWTQPIVNRVEMLSTGIRTQVGVKVFGQRLDQIHRVGAEVASILRSIPGAADVVADQIVTQPYLEARLDRAAAAVAGITPAQFEETLSTAVAGRVAGSTLLEGRPAPIRVRYAGPYAGGVDELAGLPVATRPFVPAGRVASLKPGSGPSAIRGEDGELVSYVQLNVRGRDLAGFVEEAKARLRAHLAVPMGVRLEWGGEYEHEVHARDTLRFVLPLVIACILAILYWTWHDVGDALLLFLTVPGALIGGLVVQRLCAFHFSVPVWIGYVTCFGFATGTGIIMLVYLREAIERRGGLGGIASLEELRAAVLEGAVQRLRPKLLTEGIIVLSLVPLLWSTGTGSELLRPIAAPVLGGILVADELIDLSIPALFFWVRRSRWLALERGFASPARNACPSTSRC